jgi:hypothetical protein
VGQVLAAVGVGLLHTDLDPAFHPRPLAVVSGGLDEAGRAGAEGAVAVAWASAVAIQTIPWRPMNWIIGSFSRSSTCWV